MNDPAILLCGHGSRDVEAISEFEALAGHISRHLPERRVAHGFLEFARHIDALMDGGDPGSAGIGRDDAGRAENGKAAQNAQAGVHGACGQLFAIGHENGDFHVSGGAARD